MGSRVSTEPFCKPWTGDAYAYAVANSVDAAKIGFKRCRKWQMFKLRLGSKDYDLPCSRCEEKLIDPPNDPNLIGDRNRMGGRNGQAATGIFYPKSKKVVLMHYTCSWATTLEAVYKMADHLVY